MSIMRGKFHWENTIGCHSLQEKLRREDKMGVYNRFEKEIKGSVRHKVLRKSRFPAIIIKKYN